MTEWKRIVIDDGDDDDALDTKNAAAQEFLRECMNWEAEHGVLPVGLPVHPRSKKKKKKKKKKHTGESCDATPEIHITTNITTDTTRSPVHTAACPEFMGGDGVLRCLTGLKLACGALCCIGLCTRDGPCVCNDCV